MSTCWDESADNAPLLSSNGKPPGKALPGVSPRGVAPLPLPSPGPSRPPWGTLSAGSLAAGPPAAMRRGHAGRYTPLRWSPALGKDEQDAPRVAELAVPLPSATHAMARSRDLRVAVLASCIAGAAAAVMRVPLHKVGSHNAAGRLVAGDTASGDALLLRRQSVSSGVDASKHAVELSNFMDAQVRALVAGAESLCAHMA